jgi:hypothetical protein
VLWTSNYLPARWIRDWLPLPRAFDAIRGESSGRSISRLEFDPKTGALRRYYSYDPGWSDTGYSNDVGNCGRSVRQCVDRISDA